MLPLLETIALFELIQALIDFTPAEGPDNHLLAKESPVYSTQLTRIGIVLHMAADVYKRKVILLSFPFSFLDLEEGGHPCQVVIVREYLVRQLYNDFDLEGMQFIPPAQ